MKRTRIKIVWRCSAPQTPSNRHEHRWKWSADLCHYIRSLGIWWRLKWGFCPECNSDAPELYDCPVCKGYCQSRGDPWPPSIEVRELWRSRMYRPRCPHNKILDCFDCEKCQDELINWSMRRLQGIRENATIPTTSDHDNTPE